jgi:hypothetical protein
MADTESLIDSAQTLHRTASNPEQAAVAVPQGDARYEQIGLLGEGGMGRVIEAVDKQFHRVVAIKELRGAGGDAARLQTEAFVTGNLEHPGVPPVYERGVRGDGSPFYVMRRVRGRSMEDELVDAKDLPSRQKLVRQLTRAAETLGFAHSKGVVHRDVKPQNIMVGSHGEVFVVDWGLARAGSLGSSSGSGSGSNLDTQPGQAPQHTMMGQVMGTPAYMAPEQARGDISMIDARTDVFALGAVLFRILAGRPPYDGTTTAQAVENAKTCTHPSIDELVPLAPGPLREICKKAMAAQPNERYPTAQHLADALEAFASLAVVKAYEEHADTTANVALAFGIFATLFGMTGLTIAAPELIFGPHVFFSGTFFAISAWLAVLEWRSRGTLGLAPLGYGMAASVMATGFISVGFAILNTKGDFALGAMRAAMGLTFAGLLTAMALGGWGLVLYRGKK